MKRPWTQWYWGDWMSDTGLRMSSPAARGIWMDMLCIMHQAEPGGYMLLNGEIVTASKLALFSGCNADVTKDCMDELLLHGVPSVTDDGVFYCRRMVRDVEKRGGTRDRVAKYRKKRKCNADVTPVLKASNHKPVIETDFPDELNTSKFKTVWAEWIEYRKDAKIRKMKPVTIVKQLKELAGWGEEKAILSINDSIRNAWQGLFEPGSRDARRDTSRPIQTTGGSTTVDEYYEQLGLDRPEKPEGGEG